MVRDLLIQQVSSSAAHCVVTSWTDICAVLAMRFTFTANVDCPSKVQDNWMATKSASIMAPMSITNGHTFGLSHILYQSPWKMRLTTRMRRARMLAQMLPAKNDA